MAPPGSFEADQPSSTPSAPQHGDRAVGIPRTPHFKAGSAARGGGTPVAETPGTHSPLRPPRRSPAALTCLRSFLSITPSASAHHHRGGKRLQPRAGSSRGVPRRHPKPPGSSRGEDGGSGRRQPLPAAQHLFPEHHLTIMLFSSCFFSCRFHMGNLLKVLTYNELDQGPNFFLDFESEMGFLFPFFVSSLS